MATLTLHVNMFFIGFFVYTETILAACPPGWLTWQESCYILLPTKMDWNDGLRACDRPGSNMIIPDTEGQQDFIWKNLYPLIKELDSAPGYNVELWIGCQDNGYDGDLVCFTESALTNYTNLADENVLNTGEDCIKMTEEHGGKWGYDNCTLQKFVACERRVPHRLYCMTADTDGRCTSCLLNHEIKNLTAKGVVGCGQACWAEPRCHSFNLLQRGKICQLNNATCDEADTTDCKFLDGCSIFSL